MAEVSEIYSESSLCDFCTDISILLKYPEHYYPLPRRLFQIDRAARLGCKLCALFQKSLSQNAAAAARRKTGNENADHWDISDHHGMVYYRACHGGNRFLNDAQEFGVTGFCMDKDYAQKWAIPLAYVTLTAEKGSDAAGNGNITGRPLPQDSRESSRFAEAALWLNQCKTEHSNCVSWRADCARPSRLLEFDLGPERPVIRLVDNSEARYIALSHCWGGSESARPIRLLSSDIASFKSEIKFSELTIAFQQAINVSQRFGVSHLWIDSLCIIQDSAQDWARECMIMGDIYRGSMMTISATEAGDGTKGCFVELKDDDEKCFIPYCEWQGNQGVQRGVFQASLRDQPLVAVDHDSVANRSESVQSGSVPLCSVQLRAATAASVADAKNRLLGIPFVSVPEPCAPMEQGPVFTRGWIVQEQLLSTRMLYFTSSGMYWQCQGCQRSEKIDSVLPQAEPLKFQTIRNYLTCAHETKRTGIPCTHADHTEISRHYVWLTPVDMFMSRNLFYGIDRLPALSALARRFSSILDDSYAAGLWKKTVCRRS